VLTLARIPANAQWNLQYQALFILELEWTWNCACGAPVPLAAMTNVPGIGFNNIGIQPMGTPDSVDACMQRKFTPVILGNLPCPTCNGVLPRTETIRIEGSPEYLRVKLSIVTAAGGLNPNPVAISEYLDLAQYQAVGANPPQLRYRLSSVLAHGGGLGAGHWVAGVRGPNQVFYINDHNVSQQNASLLMANPQVHTTPGAGVMQSVVLMYRRSRARGI
jgi:ubiquitin C-terminal hydrolase